MTLHSTQTLCDILGVLPITLRSWRRAGLIAAPEKADSYSDSQLFQIRIIVALTGSGDTLPEIHGLLKARKEYQSSGWAYREAEMVSRLGGSDSDAIDRDMWRIGAHYRGEDFVRQFLRPLNRWLRADLSQGWECRLSLFHAAVVYHADRVMDAAKRRRAIPLFLQAISVADATEIWMEAIRLTGEGFRVQISPITTREPAACPKRCEHHLLWCGAGISPAMSAYVKTRLLQSDGVMLCGPDTQLRTTNYPYAA